MTNMVFLFFHRENFMRHVCIIGIGAIGGAHLEIALRFLENDLIDRIYVLASSLQVWTGNLRGKAQGNNLGVKVRDIISSELLSKITFFNNLQELIDCESCRNVIICYPTSFHFQLANSLRSAGKNVLVEKPACTTIDEVMKIYDADGSSAYMVAHELPYFVEYWALLKLMQNRAINNKSTVASLWRNVPVTNQINDPNLADQFKNAPFDLGVHDVGLALNTGYKFHSIQVMEAVFHPDNATHLSSVTFSLIADNASFSISAGAIIMSQPFDAGFIVDKIVDSVTQTVIGGNGQQKKLTELYPLIPIFPNQTDGDFLAQELKHFLDVCDGKREPGILGHKLAAKAAHIMLQVTSLAQQQNFDVVSFSDLGIPVD